MNRYLVMLLVVGMLAGCGAGPSSTPVPPVSKAEVATASAWMARQEEVTYVVAVAHRVGLCDAVVTVEMPGGELQIEIDQRHGFGQSVDCVHATSPNPMSDRLGFQTPPVSPNAYEGLQPLLRDSQPWTVTMIGPVTKVCDGVMAAEAFM